jgi:hypothetical protein
MGKMRLNLLNHGRRREKIPIKMNMMSKTDGKRFHPTLPPKEPRGEIFIFCN